MQHQHFEKINSTQDEILKYKDHFDSEVLVTCDEQLAGRGQYDRKWDSFKDTLCFSFKYYENQIPSLTSLELGVLIRNYFFEEYHLKLELKWPNDIYFQHKKVAGILTQSLSPHYYAVGVGINYTLPKDKDSKYGSLFKEFEVSKKEEAKRIYSYLLANRLSSTDTVKHWEAMCIHLNKDIIITDKEKKITGKFIGLGKFGEALVESDGLIVPAYTGSLTF